MISAKELCYYKIYCILTFFVLRFLTNYNVENIFKYLIIITDIYRYNLLQRTLSKALFKSHLKHRLIFSVSNPILLKHDLEYFFNLFQGLYLFQSFDQNVVHALCSLNTKYAVKQIIACTESFLLNILLQFFLLFSLFCVTFCFSNIFMLQRKLV